MRMKISQTLYDAGISKTCILWFHDIHGALIFVVWWTYEINTNESVISEDFLLLKFKISEIETPQNSPK